MARKKPTVEQYRSSAIMWAFAVAETEKRLSSVRDDNFQAHHHALVRKNYEKASESDRELLHGQYAESTRVITIGSAWRMTLARHEFLTAAAQLQKCVDWLRAHEHDIPELPNEEFIKLLRDISEHWEELADRKSRGRFKELRPDESPSVVRYGMYRIEVGGGLTSHDVARWALRAEAAIREHAAAAGQRLYRAEDHAEHLLYDDDPPDV